MKCIQKDCNLLCFAKTNKLFSYKYQHSISTNYILQPEEKIALDKYKNKYPFLEHRYKLCESNECEIISVYLDGGLTIIQFQQMGPSPVPLINVVSVLSKLANDCLTKDMHKWWNNRQYYIDKFGNAIQCRKASRGKFYIGMKYDTAEQDKVLSKSDLRLNDIFGNDSMAYLNVLKLNMIDLAKAANIPKSEFDFLMDNDLLDLVVLGATYRGGGLHWHIDLYFEGAVFVYIVDSGKRKGHKKPNGNGKSIAFGPGDGLINKQNSLYVFWGKMTDYAMHVVNEAAGWDTHVLIFRKPRTTKLVRHNYKKITG